MNLFPRARRLVLYIIVAITCSAVSFSAHAAPQLFALMDAGDDAATFERFLALQDVDGIAVRLGWNMIEPRKHQFDWSRIDTALAAADSYHKKITLHIAASPLAATPQWVFEQGAQSYQLRPPRGFMMRRAGLEPLPWDNIYIREWESFLQDLAQHIQQSPHKEAMAYISSGVPITEMSLIGCFGGRLGDIPYNRESYLSAWKSAIGAMGKAFPQLPVLISAPVAHICMPDNDGERFYLELLAAKPADHLMIFAADLNAEGSQRLDNLGTSAHMFPVGMQFISAYSHDPQHRFQGSFDQSLCKAASYNASYIEFYKQDLTSTDNAVSGTIHTLHETGQCH